MIYVFFNMSRSVGYRSGARAKNMEGLPRQGWQHIFNVAKINIFRVEMWFFTATLYNRRVGRLRGRRFGNL